MQYTLTEDEYRALVDVKHISEQKEKDELQKLCTLAAEYVPMNQFKAGESARPHGCVLSHGNCLRCDGCPVISLCPLKPKNFSK